MMPNSPVRMNNFTQPYTGQSATPLQPTNVRQPPFSYNKQNQLVRPVSPVLYPYTMASRSHGATPPVPTNPSAPVSGSRPMSQMSPGSAYETYASHSSSPQNHYPTSPSFPVPSTPANAMSASFRTPGSSSTRLEWDSERNPISLLHEQNILPSDSADLPPRPAINLSINCDPDIMRCTLSSIPSTSKLLATCRLPLGIIVHPFRDIASPCIINSPVIVRCRQCRCYINPFVQFTESGNKWRCTVCFRNNDVPNEFYCNPDTMNYDHPSRRPEVRFATVEFIAPAFYTLRPPQSATYLFCFDVSRNAIATGYLHFVCSQIAAALTRIPGDSRRRIGFLTFNSTVHFYKMCGDSMKMFICPDVSETFIPDIEGLINPIEDSVDTLRKFLLHLPDSFAETNDVGNCLGVTLKVGLEMIQSSGGRITVFNTCLPTVGVGSLQLREEVTDMTTPQPRHMGPAIEFYKSLALMCASNQVAVDMFILNSQYCDIATLASICRYSSGYLYHYPEFLYDRSSEWKGTTTSTQDESGEESASYSKPTVSKDPYRQDLKVTGLIELQRLRRDLVRYLRRNIGFEAVLRIRCTRGLSIQSFHGSLFLRSSDLLSLPNVSPDAGFAVHLDVSESLDLYQTVCMQTALLYTSSNGDRRIRIHTLCLPVVREIQEVFAGADSAAIACLIGKLAVNRATQAGVANARDGLVNAVVDSLSAFSSDCIRISPAVSSATYGIVCPPSLRLLPLYVFGMLRYRAFSVAGVRLDDRSAAFNRLMTAPLGEMLSLIYPRLYAVHNLVAKPIAPIDATLAQTAATALSLADHGDARPTYLRSRDYKLSGANEVDNGDDNDSSSSEHDASVDKFTSDLYSSANLPGQLHLSYQSISTTGVYLLDTGELLLLLVGTGDNGRLYPNSSGGSRQTDSWTTLKQLLGITSPAELPAQCGPFAPPPLEEPETGVPIARRRLCALIALLRYLRPTNSALVWMHHNAANCLQSRFRSALIEERTECSPSYREFLGTIQKAMQG